MVNGILSTDRFCNLVGKEVEKDSWWQTDCFDVCSTLAVTVIQWYMNQISWKSF